MVFKFNHHLFDRKFMTIEIRFLENIDKSFDIEICIFSKFYGLNQDKFEKKKISSDF